MGKWKLCKALHDLSEHKGRANETMPHTCHFLVLLAAATCAHGKKGETKPMTVRGTLNRLRDIEVEAWHGVQENKQNSVWSFRRRLPQKVKKTHHDGTLARSFAGLGALARGRLEPRLPVLTITITVTIRSHSRTWRGMTVSIQTRGGKGMWRNTRAREEKTCNTRQGGFQASVWNARRTDYTGGRGQPPTTLRP